MELIEFDRWRPSVDNPRKLEYVGQRTAQEVCSRCSASAAMITFSSRWLR